MARRKKRLEAWAAVRDSDSATWLYDAQEDAKGQRDYLDTSPWSEVYLKGRKHSARLVHLVEVRPEDRAAAAVVRAAVRECAVHREIQGDGHWCSCSLCCTVARYLKAKDKRKPQ